MMIFSMSTAVLDLVEIVLQEVGVGCFKFDGRFSSKVRNESLESFQACTETGKPLLITALAGGVGLDIFQASIVIQMEAWWNINWEIQAQGRAHRCNQTKRVKHRRLMAWNADADQNLVATQKVKDRVNQKILSVIVREDHEPPKIPVVFPGH